MHTPDAHPSQPPHPDEPSQPDRGPSTPTDPRLARPWLTAPYLPTHPISAPCRIAHEQPCGSLLAYTKQQGRCFGDDRLYPAPPLLGFDIPADLRGDAYIHQHLRPMAPPMSPGPSAVSQWRDFLGAWLRDPAHTDSDDHPEVQATNERQAAALSATLHKRLVLALRGHHYDLADYDTLRYVVDLLQRLAISLEGNLCPMFVPWRTASSRGHRPEERPRPTGRQALTEPLGGVPLAVLDRASAMVAEMLPALADLADGAWTRHIAHTVLWAELNGGVTALHAVEQAYSARRARITDEMLDEAA